MPIDQGTSLGNGQARASSAQVLDFFSWWTSTLSGMAPAWLRNAFFPVRNWVRVQPAEDTFAVYSADGTLIGTLADSPRARARVRSGDALVTLDSGDVLLRQRRLPASSEANLRNAMRLQIAADTPFEIDEVFEDCRVLESDGARGLLLAEQAIARRDRVRNIQAQARECRIDLAGIDVLGPDGNPCGFNLLPEAERARNDAFLPSLNRGLALAAILLGGLVGTLYVVALDRQIGQIDAQIASVRTEAADVLALQRTARARAEAIEVIEAQSNNPIRFTSLLNTLTDALPEDSWLEGLAYDGKQVSLVGLSRSSDGLIARFEQVPGVVAARVVSSVMRDERLKADRFRIELILEDPMPASKPAVAAAEFIPEDNG